jgi:hypothetical protein
MVGGGTIASLAVFTASRIDNWFQLVAGALSSTRQ